jgi:hypothetical protein
VRLHELIDAFAAEGHCEFVAAFADPYPSLGLCELIGVPGEDRDRFRGWANGIALGFSFLVAEHIAEVDAALVQLLDYASGLAAARRAEPRDDLVTRIALAAGEDGWSDDDVTGFIAGLTFAGHETTKNQLGAMTAILAGRADLWDALSRARSSVGRRRRGDAALHPAAGDTTRRSPRPSRSAASASRPARKSISRSGARTATRGLPAIRIAFDSGQTTDGRISPSATARITASVRPSRVPSCRRRSARSPRGSAARRSGRTRRGTRRSASMVRYDCR